MRKRQETIVTTFEEGRTTTEKTMEDSGFSGANVAAIVVALAGLFGVIVKAGPKIYHYFKNRKQDNDKTPPDNSCEDSPPLLPSINYGNLSNRDNNTPGHGQWLVKGLLTAGEVSVIFSSDGQFKSGLFHQMLDDIATGSASKLVPDSNPLSSGQRVIIYEAELEEEDYAERGYTRNCEVIFGSNFNSVEDFLSDITRRVSEIKENTTIGIDDITYALPTIDPETARKTLLKLKELIAQKKSEGITLTILYVCHADKELQPHQSINLSSACGCANLARGCANVIVIGPTRFGDDYKMIKNLKPRHGMRPSTVNVLKLVPEGFFHLEHCRYEEESNVLPTKIKPAANERTESSSDRAKTPKEELLEWWNSSDKKPTIDEICKRFHIESRTASYWKEELGLTKKRQKAVA